MMHSRLAKLPNKSDYHQYHHYSPQLNVPFLSSPPPQKTVDLIDPLSYPDATATTTASTTATTNPSIPSTTISNASRTPTLPIPLPRGSAAILLSIPSHAIPSAVHLFSLRIHPLIVPSNPILPTFIPPPPSSTSTRSNSLPHTLPSILPISSSTTTTTRPHPTDLSLHIHPTS